MPDVPEELAAAFAALAGLLAEELRRFDDMLKVELTYKWVFDRANPRKRTLKRTVFMCALVRGEVTK